MGQEREVTRLARAGAHLLGDGGVERALQAFRGDPGNAREGEHKRLAGGGAGEVAKHDRRVERLRGAPGEVRGARVPTCAAAGRDEHDRATSLALREDACELDQRGGARKLGGRAARGRVAVGDDRDRAQSRGPGPLGDHGGERAVAVYGLRTQAARGDPEATADGDRGA